MLSDLVLKNRSYRAFDQSLPITKEVMTSLVDLARRTPSGMNRQPLRYRILSEQGELDAMLENCRFAASLSIKLPPDGCAPTGYIILFTDSEAKSPESLALKDVGIAAQTILLGATELGFGGCMLGSFDPARLCDDFQIPARYQPKLVIALGKPAEEVCLTAPREDGSLVYYRDENNTHYVPKHNLEDILI